MNQHKNLSVLACQIDIPATRCAQSRDLHLGDLSVKVARQLSNQHSDLVVLPELSSVDYSRESFEKLTELAEDNTGPSFQLWRKIAQGHNTTIMYSFPRSYGDQYYISIAAVNPKGELIGVYDKMHLAQFGASMEKDYFSLGSRMLKFTVKGFVVAPIICYDIRIPEMCRALAIEHNVDLIVHAGAYARDESFYSWHHFVVTRAIENQLYLLSLNRAGANYGNSMFCSPWVDEAHPPIVFSEHKETFQRFIVDRQIIQQARDDYSFRADRLEHYTVASSLDIDKD